MSYPRDLDEIPRHELEREITRRDGLNDKGLCDYCCRAPSTTSCMFPKRHAAAVSRSAYIQMVIDERLECEAP